RIVGHRVGIAQILTDGFERFHLLLPRLGPVGFASGARGDALEHSTRDRIFVDLVGRDHVDRNPFIFGDGPDIVGRHHAGVIGSVGKTITTLRPGTLAASRSVSSRPLYSAVSSPATESARSSPRMKSAMASSAYTKPRYMKLLVSNSTKTLVPMKASARGSRPGLPGEPPSPAMSGRVVPSSLTCSAGRLPSANVASFWTIPSSSTRKSLGLRPLRYPPLLS